MSERPNALLTGLLALAGGVALLLLVAVAGVAGGGPAVLVATGSAAFSACLLFLWGLEQLPLPAIVIVAFAAASAIALARSVVAATREARLLRALPLVPVRDPEVERVARESGVGRVYSTPASQPSAFCMGVLRSRVVLTDGLLARLDPEERAAVIWHEAAHVRAHEPLKSLVAGIAARTFFWMPLLGDLLERYLLVKELDADRRSTARTSRSALAGALTEVACQPTPNGAVGLAEFAAARIDRLFDPAAPLPRLFRARSIALTSLAVGTIGAAFAPAPAIGAIQGAEMWSMFTSRPPLLGLLAMLAGVALNVAILMRAAKLVRRVAR